MDCTHGPAVSLPAPRCQRQPHSITTSATVSPSAPRCHRQPRSVTAIPTLPALWCHYKPRSVTASPVVSPPAPQCHRQPPSSCVPLLSPSWHSPHAEQRRAEGALAAAPSFQRWLGAPQPPPGHHRDLRVCSSIVQDWCRARGSDPTLRFIRFTRRYPAEPHLPLGYKMLETSFANTF